MLREVPNGISNIQDRSLVEKPRKIFQNLQRTLLFVKKGLNRTKFSIIRGGFAFFR